MYVYTDAAGSAQYLHEPPKLPPVSEEQALCEWTYKLSPRRDPNRPFVVQGHLFTREVVRRGVNAMQGHFLQYMIADAMGLPGHWRYPASVLLSRCRHDGLIERITTPHANCWRRIK